MEDNLKIDKILVAVDFSDCSMNAFKHALSLAQILGSDLILTWVYNESFKLFSASDEKEELDWAEETFEGIWNLYAHEIPNNELKLIIKKGIITEQIINAAEETGAQLIVTGTYGKSGLKDLILGSNAFKLLKDCPIPVYTVNEKSEAIRPLQNILLPIDSTPESSEKKVIAAQIAKLFDANIELLLLYSEEDEETRHLVDASANEVIEYLNSKGITDIKKSSKFGTNLTNLTLEFTGEHNFDLIIIMSEQEIATSNLWMGTYARQLIKQSTIPVLSINPQDDSVF